MKSARTLRQRAEDPDLTPALDIIFYSAHFLHRDSNVPTRKSHAAGAAHPRDLS